MLNTTVPQSLATRLHEAVLMILTRLCILAIDIDR